MTRLNFGLRIDDVLFTIALVVPLACCTARFVDSERELEVIAQAQKKAGEVVRTSEEHVSVAKR